MKKLNITKLSFVSISFYGMSILSMNSMTSIHKEIKKKTLLDDSKLIWKNPYKGPRNNILIGYHSSKATLVSTTGWCLGNYLYKKRRPHPFACTIGMGALITYFWTNKKRQNLWEKKILKNNLKHKGSS